MTNSMRNLHILDHSIIHDDTEMREFLASLSQLPNALILLEKIYHIPVYLVSCRTMNQICAILRSQDTENNSGHSHSFVLKFDPVDQYDDKEVERIFSEFVRHALEHLAKEEEIIDKLSERLQKILSEDRSEGEKEEDKIHKILNEIREREEATTRMIKEKIREMDRQIWEEARIPLDRNDPCVRKQVYGLYIPSLLALDDFSGIRNKLKHSLRDSSFQPPAIILNTESIVQAEQEFRLRSSNSQTLRDPWKWFLKHPLLAVVLLHELGHAFLDNAPAPPRVFLWHSWDQSELPRKGSPLVELLEETFTQALTWQVVRHQPLLAYTMFNLSMGQDFRYRAFPVLPYLCPQHLRGIPIRTLYSAGFSDRIVSRLLPRWLRSQHFIPGKMVVYHDDIFDFFYLLRRGAVMHVFSSFPGSSTYVPVPDPYDEWNCVLQLAIAWRLASPDGKFYHNAFMGLGPFGFEWKDYLHGQVPLGIREYYFRNGKSLSLLMRGFYSQKTSLALEWNTSPLPPEYWFFLVPSLMMHLYHPSSELMNKVFRNQTHPVRKAWDALLSSHQAQSSRKSRRP